MENQEEITDHLSLSMIPGIGPRNARKIIASTGSPTAYLENPDQIRIPGVKPEHISRRAIDSYRKAAGREIRFMENEGILPLIPSDSRYPNRLRACEDGPLVLFTHGKLDLNAGRMIAVVGTRNATEYGQEATDEIVAELARYQCTLVSGLAYGIDSIAHRAALKEGIQNIGVLAHGLDRIYPGENRTMAEKMKENGGLITDFLSGTKPDRENFPARNRIVAGLSDAVVVVEAAISGGALITAGIAASYNRDVFAIPGRWGDRYSEGCNRIISHNKAAILTNASDLAWNMGWEVSGKESRDIQTSLFVDLNQDESLLMNHLRSLGTIDLDNLAIELKWPVSKTSAILLELEFKGLVRSFPGKLYQALA